MIQREAEGMEERRGVVTKIADLGDRAVPPLFSHEATVAFEDGTTAVVSIPDNLMIEVGSKVTEIETGNGKPIYNWL
jgi:hypothetical protein